MLAVRNESRELDCLAQIWSVVRVAVVFNCCLQATMQKKLLARICTLKALFFLATPSQARTCHASAEAKLWSDRMASFSSNIDSDLGNPIATGNAIIADGISVYGDSNWIGQGYAVSSPINITQERRQ